MTLSKYNSYKDKTYTLTQKPINVNNNRKIIFNNNNIDNRTMVTKWNDNNDAGKWLFQSLKSGKFRINGNPKLIYDKHSKQGEILDGYSLAQFRSHWNRYVDVIKEKKIR